MKQKVAVAISGGIDSLYAAYLLKRDGKDVTGIHFLTGFSDVESEAATFSNSASNRVVDHGHADAAASSAMAYIADQLEIPIHIVDLSNLFEEQVVDYFSNAYAKGLTPNPCLRCNPIIKFGALIEYADTIHIDRIATGHYVRTRTDDKGQVHLRQGLDQTKDQAYFLAFLSQDQLKKALFPLGNTTKQSLRKEADALGLKPVSRKESQDICFIHNDYKEFLAGRPGFKSEPGPIKNLDGDIIGTHKGLHSFTIGQRRGINCPAAFPYYVLGLDTQANALIVGPKNALFTDQCRVHDISWINPPTSFPLTVTTRIRYTHKGARATLNVEDSGTLHITFHEPVSSVTPGQGAVFYDGDEVIGGGWIL